MRPNFETTVLHNNNLHYSGSTLGTGLISWSAQIFKFLSLLAMFWIVDECMAMQGIAMINLGSTTNGLILLWGLFLYDIFWVFCTPVMVAVATNIDGPIKLLFRSGTVKKFNMLGLGDIVIPGVSPERSILRNC
jgi:hypothetical protein